MSNLFNLDNWFMQMLAKVADIIIVSIMWIVLSLTIIGFGPASTAAYYAVAKSVRRDRGGVIQEFWNALKSNFWKSVALELVVFFFAASLFFFDFAEIANVILNGQQISTGEAVFSIVKVILFFGIALYVFPIQSRFQMKFVHVIFTSLVLIVRHLFITLVSLLALISVIFICVVYPYLAFIVPGIWFYILSFPMERILLQLVPDEDREDSDQIDQWYLEK